MRTRLQPFHVSVILLGLTLLGVLYLEHRPTLIVTEARLEHLPLQIGTLVGTDLVLDDSVYAALNADTNLFRNYRSPDDRIINLYIGYYGTAKGGRAAHLPQFCYTGQGWSIDRWDKDSLKGPGRGNITINRMIVKKGPQRQLVYFWFQSEAIVMATGWELTWHKLTQRLRFQRNDGVFVRVSMDFPQAQAEQTAEKAKQFSQRVVRLMSEFWPVEKSGRL